MLVIIVIKINNMIVKNELQSSKKIPKVKHKKKYLKYIK